MRKKVLILAALAATLVAQPVLAEQKQKETRAPVTTLEGRAIYPAELRGQGSLPAPDPFPDQPVGGATPPCSTPKAQTPTWRCRTTATAQRRTPPTSSCALTGWG